MAYNKKAAAAAAGEKTVKGSGKKPTEARYSARELAANAEKIFLGRVRGECVTTALAMNNAEEATVEETKAMVAAFLKKEVN